MRASKALLTKLPILKYAAVDNESKNASQSRKIQFFVQNCSEFQYLWMTFNCNAVIFIIETLQGKQQILSI